MIAACETQVHDARSRIARRGAFARSLMTVRDVSRDEVEKISGSLSSRFDFIEIDTRREHGQGVLPQCRHSRHGRW
jgi:hypothetical protein